MAQLRMSGKAVFPLAALSVLAVACASGNPGNQSPSGSHSPVVQPVHLIEKANAPMSGDAAVAAVQYVRDHDSDLDLSNADDFSVLSVRQSADKRTHVRMQQTYQGLPVWGADIVVHGASGHFHGINGTLALHLPSMDLNPTLTADEALTIGKADYAVTGKTGRASQPLQYSRVKTDLVVFPGDGRSAKLAWHVTFYTELQEGITPGLWNYFVDAHTGDVIQKFNAIDTLSQASGPGGNAKVPRTWTDALDVEAATDGSGNYVMQTARLVTEDLPAPPRVTAPWSRARSTTSATRPSTTPTASPRSPSTCCRTGWATTRSTTTASSSRAASTTARATRTPTGTAPR